MLKLEPSTCISNRGRGTARGPQMMRSIVWGSRFAVDEVFFRYYYKSKKFKLKAMVHLISHAYAGEAIGANTVRPYECAKIFV